MYNILLIGSGKLGFRHLRGIVKENLESNIFVVDKSKTSLNLTKNKLKQLNYNQNIHKIKWKSKIDNLNKVFDLCIVSTCSKDRAKLIKSIANKSKIKFWIIEKVLAQNKKELKIIKNSLLKAESVFINKPRREIQLYKILKNNFKNNEPIRIIKSGALWGLACNAIHFIDLVEWLTCGYLKSFNTSLLDKKWYPSKRKGYYDCTGEISAKFNNGSELVLKSQSKIAKDILEIQSLDKSKIFWRINEKQGILFSDKGKKFFGKMELQSELTGKIITRILKGKGCDLPTLQISLKQHLIFLDAMLKHWNASNNKKYKKVPIT
jgi:hypothetical protein